MPKSKAQKAEVVTSLKTDLAQAKSVVFTNVQGLKAKDLVNLRRQVKKAQGVFKIAKKTLIDLALKDKKADLSTRKMEGEIGVLLGMQDPILPLKTLYDFAKEHEQLKFVAGILEDSLLDQAEVLTLAQLPSKQDLLAQLLRTLNGPTTGFVSALEGSLKGLITVLARAKT